MRLDDLRAEYDKALKSLEAAKKTGNSAAIKAAQRACDIAFANHDKEERRFHDLKRSS